MAILPDAELRDFPQVLKESYDPETNRIKVEAIVSDGVDALIINPDGSINADVTVENALVTVPYDSIYAAYPSSTVEVYTYFSDAVLVATVAVTYTDATKNFLVSVIRTPGNT